MRSVTKLILPNSFCKRSNTKAIEIPTNNLIPPLLSLIGPNNKLAAKNKRPKVTKGCRTFFQNSRDA